MDDKLIIKRILDGEKDEYRFLMDKYYKELFKYVYNLTNNYDTTEDLLQEIFFKVYKILNKFDSNKASFRTWLYRITSNYTLNHLKKKSNRFNKFTYEYDDAFNQSKTDVFEEITKEKQMNRIIEAMHKVLKPKHFEIMSLHYFSNLSPKEISITTKIPLKTVYKALKSSVEKIKQEVDINE
ncbi:MAG: RNA polymerase sigma factor [Candidatus Izimaplasma sp.]|nr:RNA polymerase sigma factor [Candidatus Izimaplasma bacterium]